MMSLTLQECSRKINANIPIPEPFSPLHHLGNSLGFHLLKVCQNAILGAKPDDDFWDAE